MIGHTLTNMSVSVAGGQRRVTAEVEGLRG